MSIKISQLPLADSITETDITVIVQDGVTKKLLISDLVPSQPDTSPTGATTDGGFIIDAYHESLSDHLSIAPASMFDGLYKYILLDPTLCHVIPFGRSELFNEALKESTLYTWEVNDDGNGPCSVMRFIETGLYEVVLNIRIKIPAEAVLQESLPYGTSPRLTVAMNGLHSSEVIMQAKHVDEPVPGMQQNVRLECSGLYASSMYPYQTGGGVQLMILNGYDIPIKLDELTIRARRLDTNSFDPISA